MRWVATRAATGASCSSYLVGRGISHDLGQMIDAKVKSWYLPSNGKSNHQQLRQASFATIKPDPADETLASQQQHGSTETGKVMSGRQVKSNSLQLQLQEEETEPTAQPKLVAVRPVPEEMTLTQLISGEAFPGAVKGACFLISVEV